MADEVVNIFAAAGLKTPDISILSDEFLAKVQGMPYRNLAVELLQKLLKGEVKTRAKRNVAVSFFCRPAGAVCAQVSESRQRR